MVLSTGTGFKEWRKHHETDAILGVVFVLAALAAFFAGRASILADDASPMVIEIPESVQNAQRSFMERGSIQDLALPAGTRVAPGIPEGERHGNYVAAKSGKYYYAADMASALRIKPVNRVWFGTIEEAEAKGYRAASGLR